MFTSEQAQKVQKLYKQTLLRLGEMLKILKQGDSSRHREKLRGHCDYLSAQGKKQNLFGWVDLMETAKIAIVEPKNDFQSTTKLIIKEIKAASEQLIQNNVNSICASNKLQKLAPQVRARLMDIQTIFTEEETIEEQEQITSTTLNTDLWGETNQEKADLVPNNSIAEESLGVDFGEQVTPEDETLELDDTDNLFENWLDDDFEDDDEQISGVFIQEQDTAINSYQKNEETDALENLLENSRISQELDIDQWNQDESEIIFEEVIESSPVEIEEFDENEQFDQLFDSLDLDSPMETEQNSQLTISQENFDVDQLDDFDNLFTLTQENTSTFEERDSENSEDEEDNFELEEILNSLDDLDIEDNFPSTGSVSTFQILKPFNLKDNKTIYYDQFTELEQILASSCSWLEIDLRGELDSLVSQQEEEKINYYEDNSELDKLLNLASKYQTQINWQELEQIVESVEIENNLTQFEEKKPELASLSSLSDLDKLLAQAENVSATQAKWKPNTRGKNANNKTTNLGRVFEQSMRVPVKQLDNLNNLIGEMVVRRNRLEEDQDKLRQFLDNLLSQVQNLSDVSSRMQDLYERSLLEGSLMDSRRRNQATVQAQLARNQITSINKNSDKPYKITKTNLKNKSPQLDELELDRFTGFHLLSQEIIELIVKVRESTSDIQFLVDETDQLGRNLREVTTQLQEGINKSRMVPFAQNADRLPLPIRKIAESYHKQVQLKIEGREVLIDKMILEHIWDPLLQLTKNSVTHGTELPEEREALGKPAQGTITVRAFLQGQQTVISVSDDGAGIDPQVIKKKAIQRKLVTPTEAQHLKRQDIYDFLFNAGFTTKEKVDSHAGRGVGLDIVRSKLNEIRGIVSIDSTLGQGSTFTIRLPLTVTVGKALCCLNDNTRIAFPMDAIEDTKDFAAEEIKVNAQGQKCISWNNELLPFRPLGTLLRYNRQITRSIVYTSNTENETVPIIILRGGNNLLAIQVDQVLGQEEIVIKQISGPLPKPKGISGATVRSDGIVMPIGDVIELIEIAQGNISLDTNLNLPESLNLSGNSFTNDIDNNQPFVLIVDDSITVREMLSLSFTKAGYRVEQARDGQEAWQKLRSGLPCDLVFCDIEMPRMNGLELLQNMQKEEPLANIPVAILSSRGAQKHQLIAAELGACAYLVKPYVERDLIDAAKRMINGDVLLAGSTKKPQKPRANKLHNSSALHNSSVNKNNKPKTARMVLIIDDSVVVREMLSMTFKKAGYQVEQARDGQEAWDKVSNGLACNLLLCDIEMPRMNGLELLAKMQQDKELSKLPVAMVTSRGAEKHRKIAADLGAKAYFTKPYLEEELLTSAKELIDNNEQI